MPFDGKEASWTIRRRTWWRRLSAQEKADLRVLRLALKDLSQPGNWIRGNYGKAGGPRCAIGHVRTHTMLSPWSAEAIASRYLAPMLPIPSTHSAHVAHWNDARGRKQEEVVALFKRAIERVKVNAIASD